MEASTQPSLTLMLHDVAAQHNRRKIQRKILPLMSHSLALIGISGPAWQRFIRLVANSIFRVRPAAPRRLLAMASSRGRCQHRLRVLEEK
jgi:hypothetical protein